MTASMALYASTCPPFLTESPKDLLLMTFLSLSRRITEFWRSMDDSFALVCLFIAPSQVEEENKRYDRDRPNATICRCQQRNAYTFVDSELTQSLPPLRGCIQEHLVSCTLSSLKYLRWRPSLSLSRCRTRAATDL